MNKIIVIVGPTGTGKTAMSVALAKYYDAVIINADSRAIYKEAKIATAAPTEEEMGGIPHYLVGNVSLNDEYTIYDFQKDGRELLNKFKNENKNVIIVGGSGLYLKALLYDYKLEPEKLENMDLSSYSNEELKEKADEIDNKNNIHVNNRQRLERYINYYYQTGCVITKTDNINKKMYDFECVGLTQDREILYDRMNKRVDKMFEMGIFEEANSLKDYKYFDTIIGYKEFVPYYKGLCSIEETRENIKKNTRHYAKRQFTWFNNQMKDIKWFNVNYDDFSKTIEEIKEYLDNCYKK